MPSRPRQFEDRSSSVAAATSRSSAVHQSEARRPAYHRHPERVDPLRGVAVMTPRMKWLRPGLVAAAGVVAAGAAIGVSVASDHQDSPDVELNPTQDMTDFYAFPSATAGR